MAPRHIFLRTDDQARQLAWSRADHDDPRATVDPVEALRLYERNGRVLDRDAMTPDEAALLERLVATVGRGVLLV